MIELASLIFLESARMRELVIWVRMLIVCDFPENDKIAYNGVS